MRYKTPEYIQYMDLNSIFFRVYVHLSYTLFHIVVPSYLNGHHKIIKILHFFKNENSDITIIILYC